MKLIASIFLLFPFTLIGQGYFQFSEELKDAYQSIVELKLEEGREQVAQIKRVDPDNKLTYLVEDYIDFFTLFLQEDIEDFKRLESNKDRRIEELKKGDDTSPYYLFSIAEVHLHWAAVRLKFDEKLSAAREVYSAYKLLKKNNEKFPDFISNKKSLSIIHSLAESIPSWIRTVAGVEGSIQKGTSEIKALVKYGKENDYVFYEEAIGICAYILFYQNNQREEAYQVLKDSGLNPNESLLITFLMANMAQKTGRNEEAIAILENRPQGSEYLPFYYIDFMLGKFQLYRLDDGADDYILRFINEFNGRHFIKEAYQKLAWYELAKKDNLSGYKKYMALSESKGYGLIDEDKQAAKEAAKKLIPNNILLQARLLFDGGYFAKAYKLLVLKAHLFEGGDSYTIEYLYRLGRVEHELENLTEALKLYRQILSIDNSSYMACNAALQAGYIYEGQKLMDEAHFFYEKCLDISPDEYKTSLHQKAKSGLNRLKKYRS